MGKTYKYYCPKCNHEVYTSGELASGFFVVVEPYICKDCNELTDVAVGITGQKMSKDELPKDEEIEFYKCTNCSSENIRLWNKKLKPCPKCGSKMKKGQEVIMWD